MQPFRLLNLPQVVLDIVFQSGLNIVHLALCSSKALRIVTNANLKGRYVEVTQKSMEKRLVVSLLRQSILFEWDFQFQKKKRFVNEKKLERVSISGHSFWIKKNYTGNQFHPIILSDKDEKTVEVMRKFVKLLVKAPIVYKLSVDGVRNFKKYFMRNVVSEDCGKLSISGTHCQNGDGDSFEGSPIPHEIMNLVLDNTLPHCILSISSSQAGFSYKKKLHFKSLHLHDSSWYTAENLLKTRTERLYARRISTLNPTVLKEFITGWMNGEYPETQCINLYSFFPPNDIWENIVEAKQILYNGLDVTIWKSNETLQLYGHFILAISNYDMADFQRADGVRATIGIGSFGFFFVCEN